MKTVNMTIVCHGGFGHTERLATAVASGTASIEGVEVAWISRRQQKRGIS